LFDVGGQYEKSLPKVGDIRNDIHTYIQVHANNTNIRFMVIRVSVLAEMNQRRVICKIIDSDPCISSVYIWQCTRRKETEA
jgi:hypothetical protein